MKRRGIDECRARGCGGWLRGVGDKVYDGEIVYCCRCGREHTFHVPVDGGLVRVEIARKPRREQVQP